MLIKETSLSRIYSLLNDSNSKNPVGFISACRMEFDEKENERRTKQLESKISSSHYGYIKLKGSYLETDKEKDTQKQVFEDAFCVIGEVKGLNDKELKDYINRFKNNLISWMRIDGAEQEEIILKLNPKGVYGYNASGSEIAAYDRFGEGDLYNYFKSLGLGYGFSQLKNKKRFSFLDRIQAESFHKPKYSNSIMEFIHREFISA